MRRFSFLLFILFLISMRETRGQDVVRVKTELVQTDVTVVDKHGKFVDGLTADDFELSVDSKPQPLSFFEQVIAGSRDEEKQLTAARKGTTASRSTTGSTADRGRLIFFFVDDLHLAGDSLDRARNVLLHFIENKMRAKDRVAVLSTSGQIGFLQQLTDNKAVLREAISRLTSKFNPEATASHVAISEVDANLISSHADRGLFAYLIEATMREYQIGALNAYTIVKNRVNQINAQAKIAEVDTLSRLESLMRSTGPLPGRKLMFFISDGFVVDTKRSSGADVMRRVATEAARVGMVVYSLGTRSLSLGPGTDVSSNAYPDFSPRTANRTLAESKMPQEPLETLAEETGGRSYLNPSALDDGVDEALTQSSAYYLLVWRPNGENQRAGKSRLKVVVKGRPELRVRMRRHYFDFRESQAVETKTTEASSPENDLKRALGSLYPLRDLSPSVSGSFTKTAEKGAVLNVSMQIDGESLSFENDNGKQQAIVDVMGVAVDDRGRISSFKQKLDIPREVVSGNGDRFIKWTQSLPLPPGLYQVRVAFRDRQAGRTGSAMTWIEIPQQ